jgi:hypothetical protein
MADSVGNNPNIDPANNDTLAGTLQSVFNQLLKNVDTMLPARVLKYDRDTNRVQVEVLIAMISTSGQQVSRAQIANIPVINIGGGGFIINFPLKGASEEYAGDLGFIMANDRDISLFLQSYSEAPPNTNRVKNFSDSVFIPSALTGYTVDGSDTDNMVIQSLDGKTKISLGSQIVDIECNNPSPTNNCTIKLKVTNDPGSGAGYSPSITMDNSGITLDSPLVTCTGLLKTLGGLAVYGIATGVYSAYFGGPIYPLGGGFTNVSFTPGVPGAPVPPPTPP